MAALTEGDMADTLQIAENRRSHWGSLRIRVTRVDGSVVEGKFDGSDAEGVSLRLDDLRVADVGVGEIRMIEGRVTNLLRAIMLGILSAAPTVFVLLAPIKALSTRGSAVRPGAYFLALAASAALARFVFKHERLAEWASRWKLMFGGERP